MSKLEMIALTGVVYRVKNTSVTDSVELYIISLSSTATGTVTADGP